MHCISNDKYMPYTTPIKLKEMLQDASLVMQYKNKSKRRNIKIEFDSMIFNCKADYERIFILVCSILQITIDKSLE